MVMSEVILRLVNITKSFFGNNALTDINFDLRKDEIHCICGENGAGKSTLIKILTGALSPDGGVIRFEGKEYDSLLPKMSHDLGIHAIYQENLLLNDMDVAENIFVGQEKTGKFSIINYKELYKDAQQILDRLNVSIRARDIVGKLSVANQQYVKIARALASNPKVLIMDEPTTMFNVTDAERLLDIVKNLKKRGISIIYISHKLAEVLDIADRVTILRDGCGISCREKSDSGFSIGGITSDMIGRPVDLFYKRERLPIGKVVFEVRDLLVGPGAPPVSFSLRKGEVLGIAGMVGAGRTEIAQAIFGMRKKYGGRFFLHEKEINLGNPRDAIRHGICLITEDRQKTGLLLDMKITPNITITAMNKLKGVFIDLKEEDRNAMRIIEQVNLKALNYRTDVRFLSGGNQQKVIVGKWIYRDAKIIIFDEPTRGIDVNSKAEIYALMVELLKDGKSIIMISSDMPELISISDRVLIIKKGEIAAQLEGDEIAEKNIISKTI
jgi:ABC-type sugar transport system ATPase subunit